MIDINELRRLAQAATPGPWWVNQDSLNHGFECGVLEINAKDWHALAGAWGVTGAKPSEEGAANAAFIAAANPAAINELLDRIEAAEKDIALKERVIDSLGVILTAVVNERDELRATMEKIADWYGAWGPYPETNKSWCAMAIVTAREAVKPLTNLCAKGEEK